MANFVCIFEDVHYSQLLPLVYFRPVYNLRCGILSLKEKLFSAYPKAEFSIHCRTYLADYMKVKNPGVRVNEISGDECLFINGRVIADEEFSKKIPLNEKNDIVYVYKNQVVAARVSGKNLAKLKKHIGSLLSLSDFDGISQKDVNVDLISYSWDLIQNNRRQLVKDFALLVGAKKKSGKKEKIDKGVYLLNEKNIFIDDGVTMKPGTVLDAEGGPIFIGKNVQIFPHATIIGPAYIGEHSLVKTGAQIYSGTTIGPICKVGGEIESSIIHGYSNKQHHGFLGHSYVGAWANLGAGTTVSDLKNNYHSVKVTVGGEQVDTGLQFVGLTLGDHAKTAINSMFNTGTVVGVSSNIFGDGFPPKYVPSFSWGAAGETFTTYNIDRAIDVARRVMLRRNIVLTQSEDKLFRKIFDLTGEERRLRGMPL
ncbi:MAG: GlmU family protein [Ignavibacteriales bacterium]|nr:GlmU family protein [Ignavibacteriales bacterium]